MILRAPPKLNFLSLFSKKILSIMQLQIKDLLNTFKYIKNLLKVYDLHFLQFNLCGLTCKSCGPTWVITPIKSAKEFCEAFL
jgi:hypothetical protein